MKQFSFKPARVFSEYLKIQNIIFTSIQLEVEVLNKHRQFYNPNKFSLQIEKAYKSNNLAEIISAISLYSSNAILFYFLPLWIISFPFHLFLNLKILRSAWLKISFSISEYKVWTKNSLVSNFRGTLNLKIIVSFFPFIFGISYIIYSRYQNQIFTYFIHKNLPGAYPSFPKLRWETFQNMISHQLTTELIDSTRFLPTKNLLLPNEVRHFQRFAKKDSKTIDIFTQPENKNEFFNFSSNSSYKKSSMQADNSQLPTTSALKLNKFIKQVDFYNDSFLIKLNSNWLNKKKQIYVGVFPKKNYLRYSGIYTNLFLNPPNSCQIGNNWHLASPKDCITFSYILPTKLFNQEVHFAKTENLTKCTISNKKLHLNQNLTKESLPSFNQSPFLNDTRSSSQSITLRINSSIRNYWEVFYLNLDELPKKLNSRSIPISNVGLEYQLSVSPSETSSYNLSNKNLGKAIQTLSLKNYLNEYQDFIMNASSGDIQNRRQIATINLLNTKVSDHSSQELKKDGVDLIGLNYHLVSNLHIRNNSIKALDHFFTNFEVLDKDNTYVANEIKFKYQKIYNLFDLQSYIYPNVKQFARTEIYNIAKTDQLITPYSLLNKIDRKDNLNFQNQLVIQTIDGFSTNYPVSGFKEAYLTSESLLRNKFNLLQNELRQYFYDNGLKPLPHFFKLATNLNIYKTVSNLLLKKNFIINDSPIVATQDQNPAFFNFNEFLLNEKQTVDSTLISRNKPSVTIQREINDLKNNSKVLLVNFTPDQRVILSKLQDYSSEQILQVLQDFGPLKINLAIQPRTMSGYEFPDTSSLELRSLISQYFYQTTASLRKTPLLKRKIQNKLESFSPSFKVELPPSFTSYLNYNYSKPETPSFQLNYRPTFLQGVKKTLYEGPGVLRDNLTQDLNLTNKKEIHQWIKQFLSSDNPLTDRREVFFGHNSTKLAFSNSDLSRKKQDDKTTFANQENVIATPTLRLQTAGLGTDSSFSREIENTQFHKSVYQESNLVEIQKVKKHIGQTLILKTGEAQSVTKNSVNLPVLPFIEEFQVPYLNKFQWQTILEKLKANLEQQLEDKSELEKKFQVDVPLVRIRNPKQHNIQWPLNQLDYQNLNDFIFNSGNNLFDKSAILTPLQSSSIIFKDITYPPLEEKNLTSINYHYIPSAKILLNDNLAQKKIFGNVYKKAFTVYKNILENKYESFNGYKRKNYATNIFLKNFSTVFYQSWEPITIGSWMMITQLSFGLVVLQILQEFYRKYGKELISYLLDLIASLGIIDESLKEELELDDGRKGFRLIRKVPKRFRDIAGIDSILPELGEIVWFLRNSGRSFKVGNIIPKGILLVGSPGTGKTLLVQAIAGEAEVPVLVQSGSSLNDPEQEGVGAQNLKNLFEQARQMAPCIVFIDEIDAMGEKRENVIQNPMGTDEIIESIQEHVDFGNLANNQFIPKPKIKFGKNQSNDLDTEQQNSVNFLAQDEGANQSLESSENLNLGIMQQSIDKQEAKQEQLSLLMQFLIEMDGLRARKGVIVIGATNRPEVLDLALTRPGRFDQTLQLGLPERQKRIDILKLYSKNIGTVRDISWDYLANRTVGFSAADLAAVMNESSIKAILGETIHTIETIEEGIESITSYSSEKIELKSTNCVDPFFISRLAYYQAGKAVVHTLLLQHPPITVLHLWPRKKNARHTYISSIIQNKFLKISRKLELESRVVGLYAGKAAELLILSNPLSSNFKIGLLPKASPIRDQRSQSAFVSQTKLSSDHSLESTKLWQSDIGIEDLNFATSLVESMISKWYFYSKNLIIHNSNQIFYQRNLQEISELDTIDLFNELAIETETTIIKKTRSSGLKRDFQKWSIRPWWQTQITRQIGVLDPAYDDWYRIYLPDPEESERNEEWMPPDEYYHNNNNLSDLALNSNNSSINWNDLYANDRDYISHGLLLTCFNTAFTILDKNRELLDYLASYLMRNDILREHEINDILLQFKPKIVFKDNTALLNTTRDLGFNDNYSKSKILKQEMASLRSGDCRTQQNSAGLSINKVSNVDEQQTLLLEENEKVRITEKSWGKYSRRKMFRFFRF